MHLAQGFQGDIGVRGGGHQPCSVRRPLCNTLYTCQAAAMVCMHDCSAVGRMDTPDTGPLASLAACRSSTSCPGCHGAHLLVLRYSACMQLRNMSSEAISVKFCLDWP